MLVLDCLPYFHTNSVKNNIIIKFFRQSTTNVTLLAPDFRSLKHVIRPRKMNFVELCAEQEFPFLHVNKKLHHALYFAGLVMVFKRMSVMIYQRHFFWNQT